jgi:hypothetical protein
MGGFPAGVLTGRRACGPPRFSLRNDGGEAATLRSVPYFACAVIVSDLAGFKGGAGDSLALFSGAPPVAR